MSVNEGTGYDLLTPSNGQNVEVLAKDAAAMALYNFEWRFITFVFYNMSVFYGVDIFSREYQKSVIVGCGTFYPRFSEDTHQYVLFGSDVTNIAQMLAWMRRHQFDNTGKYIIICLSKYDCDESEAVNMLWHYKIVNVVFLKSGDGSNVTDSYTYFYKDFDFRNIRPEKLGNWMTCTHSSSVNCAKLFPLKLTNLQSCPIIASAFTQTPYMKIINGVPSGADGDLLRLIAEKLNASLKMMTPHRGFGWGKLEQDGTWSGSLADVYYDLANLSMTSASITLSRFTHFQMSMGYNTVYVGWVTHPSALESPSLKLFHPFKFEVRIALAVSFLSVVVLSVLVKSSCWNTVFKAINVPRPRRSLVFYSWELCMGLPATKLPTKLAFLYVVLFWIWYCFLVRTFYTVFLIKALKTKVYYSDLLRIEDAIAANYGIGGGLALKDYYVDEPAIYNRWINFESNEIFTAMLNLSKGQKYVIAMNLETSKIFQRNHSLDLHTLPQKVISSPAVIFFKKFSPLAQPINTVLTQLVETGFTSKLYKNYTKLKISKRSGLKNKAFNMVHFTGCYAILFLGWIVSFICFVIEKYKGRSRNHK